MHFWKGAKFVGSVICPMTKMLSASGGLRPLDPLTTAYDPPGKNPVGAPVGQLYYTVWSKSAVGNADCSFKNIFLSAQTSRDLVTLTFDLLTLNSYRTWRVT